MTDPRWTTTAAALLALILGPAGLRGQPAPDGTPTGWYRDGDGRRVLVSPAPDSGYRYLDFEGADFGSVALVPAGEADSGTGVRALLDGSGAVREIRSSAGVAWRRMEDAPYTVAELAFAGDGGVPLAGLLLRPDRPRLGAVMIHGSGDSDRDNAWAYTFAHALADAGVCVLFPDKRGSGGSGGDWRRVGLDALARDAVAAAEELADRCGLADEAIGWVGLSQGGWVAPVAHRFAGGGAFQVAVSAAAVPVFDQMAHETLNALRAAGAGGETLDRARELLMAVRDRATGRSSWSAYVERRDSLGRGPLADLVSALPGEPDHWRWAWWSRVGRIDPLASWAQSEVPVLVVYGQADETDNVPVARSVRRLEALGRAPGSPSVDVSVFPELGHTLVDDDTGWIDRGALDRIVRWVLARADDTALRLPER